MEFNVFEKKFLSGLGRNEDGRDLIAVLKRVRDTLSSIDNIESGKDYGAQVEGRKLFRTFVNKLIEQIHSQSPSVKPREPDDFT